MNTKRFFFAVAAVALAACTQIEKPIEDIEDIEDIIPETPAYSDTPIALTYSTVDAVETKAAQNLNEGAFASGESVKVRISNTGESTWSDYTFTTGAAGAMEAPDPAPYYPAGSQKIDIVAYYPASAGTSFTVASDQTDDDDYKASDLMFASVTNQAKQAAAVNLAFSHKMAKLNVNITAGQGVASINSLSVLNVKPTVSFDQATGEVGAASGDATSITMSNNGSVIIPAQTINGGLLSIVTDKGTATYTVTDKVFEAGKLYTINITVNLRAVGTSTEISGWTSEGTVNVTPGDWTVSVSGTYTYNGSAIVPDAANITVHSTSAGADIDASNYDVFVNNNINAGEATLIVSGKGAYAGEVASCTYTIAKAEASISYATATLSKNTNSLDFICAPTNTGDGTVTYTSGDESVATVNSTTGEVDVLSAGTTRITATIADGANYTYPTKTAYYDITVVEAAATISALKTMINQGTDCTSFVGFQVNADGDIDNTVTDPVGYISYLSTADVDTSVPGSRILVLATTNDANVTWGIYLETGATSDSGYSNTKTLQKSGERVQQAAYKAWNHSASIPSGGSTADTDPSHWFLPSSVQIKNCWTALGGWTSWWPEYYYWTSTEIDKDYAIYLDKDGTIKTDPKGNLMSVRACFAY